MNTTCASTATLQLALDAAAPALESVVARMQDALTGDCEIREVEVEVAFSSAGHFLGFGAGGALTLRTRLCPRGRAPAAPKRHKRVSD